MEEKEFVELRKKDRILSEAASVLRVLPEDLPRVVKRFKKDLELMKRELGR